MASSVITPETHAQRFWAPPENWNALRGQHLLPLALDEVLSVASAFPLGFGQHGGKYLPVAVLGLQPGVNVFVGPAGQWLGRSLLWAMHGHGFDVLPTDPEEKNFAITFDEQRGRIVPHDHPHARPFLGPDQRPTPEVQQLAAFLIQRRRAMRNLQHIADMMEQAKLIEPWPIEIEQNGQRVQAQGLFRPRLAALEALDDAAYLQLRRPPVLPIMYAMATSAGLMGSIGEMHRIHAQMAQAALTAAQRPAPASGTGDLKVSIEGGVFKFD